MISRGQELKLVRNMIGEAAIVEYQKLFDTVGREHADRIRMAEATMGALREENAYLKSLVTNITQEATLLSIKAKPHPTATALCFWPVCTSTTTRSR